MPLELNGKTPSASSVKDTICKLIDGVVKKGFPLTQFIIYPASYGLTNVMKIEITVPNKEATK
jgi:hypothetical protein